MPILPLQGRRNDLAARLQTGPIIELARLQGRLAALGASSRVSPGEFKSSLNELGRLTECIIGDINEAIHVTSAVGRNYHHHEPGSDLFSRLRRECAAFADESGLRCEFLVDADHVTFDSLVGEVEVDGVGMSGMTPASLNHEKFGFGLWNVDICVKELGGFLEFYSDQGLKVRIVLPGPYGSL